MPEQYRTIGREQFSLSTAHTRQDCTNCSNKYYIPEFPILPMIDSLYDSTILDT